MVKVTDLPNFDMAESLKAEEDIVVYLNMVLEDNDSAPRFDTIHRVVVEISYTDILNKI